MLKAKTKITPENTEKDSQSFTYEELSQFVDYKARKLGALLASAPMPDDIKEAWVDLLGDMTLDQIDELLDILEFVYVQNATAVIDDYFDQVWQQEQEKFEDEQDKEILDLKKQIESIQRTAKELN